MTVIPSFIPAMTERLETDQPDSIAVASMGLAPEAGNGTPLYAFAKGRGLDAFGALAAEDAPAGFDRTAPTGRGARPHRSRRRDKGLAQAHAFDNLLTGTTYIADSADHPATALPPAPRLGSSELSAELAEVYAMALVRDMPLEALSDPKQVLFYKTPDEVLVPYEVRGRVITVQDLLYALNRFDWFDGGGAPLGGTGPDVSTKLTRAEQLRRNRGAQHAALTPQRLFRGSTLGADQGGYLSRFLQTETIRHGAQYLDQRNSPELSGLDYMTDWSAWLDVQNGVDVAALDTASGHAPRAVQTGRDLARTLRSDTPFQPYHMAALMLRKARTPLAKGLVQPNALDAIDAFAPFDGPDVPALFAEVSRRALKALRGQKGQANRTGRPERLAALVTLAANGQSHTLGSAGPVLDGIVHELHSKFGDFMALLAQSNARQNSAAVQDIRAAVAGTATRMASFVPAPERNYLLPMAAPDGARAQSDHAVVAGACVTVLKAFFRTVDACSWARTPFRPGQAQPTGTSPDTLEGELNKLAANMAIGMDFGGARCHSDGFEGLRLGERVAAGIVQEHLLSYTGPACLKFHSFDGDRICIKTDGQLDTRIHVQAPDGAARIETGDWWSRHSGVAAATARANWFLS